MKQIVGGSLRDGNSDPVTNFVSKHAADYYADLYRKDGLKGGHVIMLGPNNETPARAALSAYPGGLQIGGGICPENAAAWLAAGASHVVVTSYLFDQAGRFAPERLDAMVREVGAERLIIDLSCRVVDSGWVVAMNRWQTLTDLRISRDVLHSLEQNCAEFLIHAADVEGKCEGIDADLVAYLGAHCRIPVTYAGGVNSYEDLAKVEALSRGKVDLTIGSALDIFGGSKVRYADCVRWNRREV